MMKIFETHTHYEDDAFDGDREIMIEKARKAGVRRFVDVGSDIKTSTECLKLAENHEDFYAAVGIHPEYALDYDSEKLARIEALAAHPKCVAIGEIGLDYHWEDACPRDKQKEAFIAQLELAIRLNKSIIIHSRDAAEDTLEILRKYYAKGNQTSSGADDSKSEEQNIAAGNEAERQALTGDCGAEREGLSGDRGAERQDMTGAGIAKKLPELVMHCYGYSPEMAEEFVKMGFYIGVGGVVTFKNAKKLVETVRRCDISHLVVETDSPYMSPEPERGQRNDSSKLVYVVKKIAEIKGMDPEYVAEKCYENACRLYGL